MNNFGLMIAAITTTMFILTYFLNRYFKHRPKAKYFLPLLAFILTVYNYYLSRTINNGFEDLARLIIAMLYGSATIAGLLSCLFFDYLLPRWRR